MASDPHHRSITPAGTSRLVRRNRVVGALAAIVLLAAAGFVFADYWRTLPEDSQAEYVGRQQCVQCHTQQMQSFADSHHDRAMEIASEQSVLGDFNNATLEHHGIISRMYRDGKRYMIHTEGPEGTMQDFQIQYTLGVQPLQQYMVEFDRDGSTTDYQAARLQVLRVSWDTQAKKWFYLDPPDVQEKLDPHDDLHWTGITQRWNTMCADCHSTDLHKHFDPRTNHYHTTWSEIDVSCEACHGPGSLHVKIARDHRLFWDRHHGDGLVSLADAQTQIESCAPCHSRRRVLKEGFQPGQQFCDFYEPELLGQTTYHANGEILDEVYVYGSFTQSKMYHKGIKCSDCHDPHSLKLKHSGNQTCTSCHAHPAGKYDTPSHHHHSPDSPGASCVECHMPETTYMAVDPRRDHSIRIPRPDLSVSLDTPNACTGCHIESLVNEPAATIKERSPLLAEHQAQSAEPSANQSPPGDQSPASRDLNLDRLHSYADWLHQARDGNPSVQQILRQVDQWADAACDRWYGENRNRSEHFAAALVAARKHQPDALEKLAAVAEQSSGMPDIARATAVAEIPALLQGGAPASLVRKSLQDKSPLVRASAIRALQGGDATQIRRLVVPLLSDSSRLVRSEAARLLSVTGGVQELSSGHKQALRRALDEYREGLMTTNDRSGAYLAWATILESQGRYYEAVKEYETAIRVQPESTGPRSNLASLLESMIQARQISPTDIQATSERISKLRKSELPLLQRDADLVPDNGPLQYRLGLALYLDGQASEGLKRLKKAVAIEPTNPQFLLALALLLQKLNQVGEAIQVAQTLIQLQPNHPEYQALIADLKKSQSISNAQQPKASGDGQSK